MDDTVLAETANDRELAKRAYIERLTLLDDLFMGLVFEDRRCVELVLRIILGIGDLCVEESRVKHTMANLAGRSAQTTCLPWTGGGVAMTSRSSATRAGRYRVGRDTTARCSMPRRLKRIVPLTSCPSPT